MQLKLAGPIEDAGLSKYGHVHFRKSCNELHVYMKQSMLLSVLLKFTGKSAVVINAVRDAD